MCAHEQYQRVRFSKTSTFNHQTPVQYREKLDLYNLRAGARLANGL